MSNTEENFGSSQGPNDNEQTLEIETFVNFINILTSKYSSKSKSKLTPSFELISPEHLLKAIIDFCLKFTPKNWSDLMLAPQTSQVKEAEEVGWRWVARKAMTRSNVYVFKLRSVYLARFFPPK